MARIVIGIGAAAWLLAGAGGVLLAAVGTDWLIGVLPPLAVGTDGLRRALAAFSLGLLVVAASHTVVLVGLRARAGWAYSAAILLAGVLAATLLSLSAASVTSAAAGSSAAVSLVVIGLAAFLAASAYALAGARLVAEMRSRARD